MLGHAIAIQAGLALGLASALSIGPNNIMLMREGLLRGRVGLVATLISVGQAALVITSWWLASHLHNLDPTLRAMLSWTAVFVLFHFALQSFRSAGAIRQAIGAQSQVEGVRACVVRVLPIMLLNPLSYLEYLFVPAAIMEILDKPGEEMTFLATVVAMLVACNLLYGFGGRLMSGVARSGPRLRVFDLTSCAALCCVASLLALNLSFS